MKNKEIGYIANTETAGAEELPKKDKEEITEELVKEWGK